MKMFKKEGVWLKGNTHAHSTLSDGVLEPQARIDQYSKEGYDFFALTDHLKTFDTSAVDPKGMVLIPAIEFHPNHPSANSGPWHLIALNVKEHGTEWSRNLDAQYSVDHFLSQGAYIIICHPYWLKYSRPELQMIKGAHAVEVYNHVCEVSKGLGESTNEFDSLSQYGTYLHPIAADDCHNDLDDCFGGWIMVKAASKSLESIMEAIHAGDFYATMGPEFIDIKREGDNLHVKTSPVKKIKFISFSAGGAHVFGRGDELVTEACVPINNLKNFVRVQIEGQWTK